jgi:GT2 family glycosyltransferase
MNEDGPGMTTPDEISREVDGGTTRSRLDIVIVNWNTGPHLRECLLSVSAARQTVFDLGDVVVVDNASSDCSLLGIEDLSVPLRVLRNAENRGFAAACNQGAAEGRGDLVLFLNPDTRLFPETLDRSVSFMADRRNRAIGICGAQMVGPDDTPEFSCSRFPTLWMFVAKMLGLSYAFPQLIPQQRLSPSETNQSRCVDQVIGAYFLIRRPLFEALGGFDERFFVYMEDVDLAYRARQLGYPSYFLKHVSVYHREGASSEQVRGKRLFYLLRGRTEYARKHWPAWQALLLGTLILAIELPARGVIAAARGGRNEAKDIVEATRLYARYLLGE